MIIVTGANGPYGRLVVERLLALSPAAEVAVSVRDPAAGPWVERGLDVRQADFDDPGSLAAAFAGGTTILVNGTNYGTEPEVRAAQQAAAITAAAAVGVDRIVLTSWQDVDNCPLPMASCFPGTEKLVAEAGPQWTILRLCFGMAASLARDVRSALAAGHLSAPAGEARATPAAVADLAEATARVLTQTGHQGRTYELTGPAAVSWADLATLATRLAGHEIAYRSTSDDEFREIVLATGFPPGVVDGLLAYYAAFRAGWANTPSDDLGRLLGRPPVDALDAVAEHV
jgi:NAD(P)H dehydrogenase (quinone)